MHCPVRINAGNTYQQPLQLTLVFNTAVFFRNSGSAFVFTNFILYNQTVCDQAQCHLTTLADYGQIIIPYPKLIVTKYCDNLSLDIKEISHMEIRYPLKCNWRMGTLDLNVSLAKLAIVHCWKLIW